MGGLTEFSYNLNFGHVNPQLESQHLTADVRLHIYFTVKMFSIMHM